MRTQDTDGIPVVPRPASGPAARRLVARMLSKSWDDGIFSMAAQAAYWETLSLPPLLLGMLGSMGYVAALVGPDSLVTVQHNIIRLAGTIFDRDVVTQFIEPTVADILSRGRPDIISIGFPLALFAGSSAISSLVDSITFAHEQYSVRHPVWQRIFALLLYLGALVVSVATLPLLALGPVLMNRVLPSSWTPTLLDTINTYYYPVVLLVLVAGLTALYKAALPRSLPWRRLLPGAVLAMAVFAVSATGLRIYIAAITSAGYTYGALATPIAFLLFAFLIGFAIVLGAQLNNAIQETWPVRPSHRRYRIQRMLGIRQLTESLGLAREPAPALDEPEVAAVPPAVLPEPAPDQPANSDRARRPHGRPPRLSGATNRADRS
ncbi:MAG: YihY/virulence factor BrkB family protein [Pseudonocardiales bacterium]|nr:YihY/virulence factor BrkB family protein [Pseudonocardiales bacterium]